MDIAALSIGLSHSEVKQQASLAVMNNVIDQAKIESINMIQMLEQSASMPVQHPYLGSKIDIKA